MPEQDAEEEDVRAEKQARVEQGFRDGERMPSTTSASHLASTEACEHLAVQLCTYASFWPRNVFVNSKVNQIRILCGPPSGSLASTSRISPNRSRRRAEGREPDGASRRRKSRARIRSSPSLNDFLGVLS